MFGRKKSGHNELLKRLFELGHSNEQVVNEILALLVGVTVEVSLGRCNPPMWRAVVLTLLFSFDKRSQPPPRFRGTRDLPYPGEEHRH